MYACLHLPDFPVQAALWCEPEQRRELLNKSSVVILEGPASHKRVIALNEAARAAGVTAGMTKLQAESFGAVFSKPRSLQSEAAAQKALLDCALAFSPRAENTAPGTVIADLEGTEKLFGPPQQLAARVLRQAREFGFSMNVALAANPDAAACAARSWEGITVIPQGREAQFLSRLPVGVLFPPPEVQDILESWGIRNLGALAALPEVPVVERLGQEGLSLQRLARGEVSRTIVPIEPADEFTESFEFEDPVETLESLTFLLNRLLQQLCSRLNTRSLATSEFHVRLEFEVHQIQAEPDKEVYERVWKLPLPVSDAKVLLRLTCLDLESCSFSAPIKKLIAQVVPAKPRSSQGGLFAPASPQAEQLEITLARIRGIVGREDESGIACAGSPQVVDSHKSGRFAVQAFSSKQLLLQGIAAAKPAVALRRFRPAMGTNVELAREKPYSVLLGKKSLRVLAASGPWSSSGHWWNRPTAWVHEEWDVALKTSDGMGLYRIYLDRIGKQWFVEGMFD